jgi:DNA-binding GntR family transcriptional regulator
LAQAASRAYEVILEAVMSGRFAAGDHLPEEELAALADVSRTPVREALRQLAAEGSVEFLPNRGAHVARWSLEEMDEIFSLRALLESHGAGLAAARADEHIVQKLRELQSEMEAVAGHHRPNLDRVAELNNGFHQTILAAAGSQRLVKLLSTVVLTPLVQRTFRRYSIDALQRSLAHHRELIAAFDARDGEWAASVMRSHILAARAVLLRADDADIEGIARAAV